MLWGLCGDSLPTGKWIAIKKHQQALRLTSQPKHTPLRLAQVGNCLRKTRQRLVAKPQLTLEQCKMAKRFFAQCTNTQRFGSAVNKHKHSTKALRKTQQYQKLLVCKWQSTRFCNKKKRLEQSNRFVLRSTLR